MATLTQEFIDGAQRLEKQTGIPASITLAQIIQESSGSNPGGLSGLAYKDKNLFGVKGQGTAGSSYYPTKEFQGGRYVTVNAAFRKYNSFSEAFDDRAKFLSGPRYQKAFTGAKSVNDYANGLKSAGYATDPNYANKLLSTIQSNGLAKYDSGNHTFTPVTELSGSDGATIEGNVKEDKKESFTEQVMGGTIRAMLVFLFIILAIVFFLKAFPATDAVASTVTGAVNPLNKIKAASKLAKVAKGK